MILAAGWYADPLSAEQLRWWSGEGWTENVQPRLQPQVTAPTAQPVAAPIPAQRNPAEQAADVWLPPMMIEYGDLPAICVRHGRSAVRFQKVTVHSRPPAWAYALLVAGLLIAALVMSAIRIDVTGGWPMCDVCVARRKRLSSTFRLCVASWFSLAVAGVLLASGLLLLLLLPLFVAGVVLHEFADWRRFTSATVDRATNAVHVNKPSRGFVEGLPTQRRAPERQMPVGVRRW